jgi:DNA-binding beta-propeller fold protein YncE
MRHLVAVAAILCLAAVSGVHAQDGPYRAGKEIPIGGEGGWDYLSVDAAAHRLYVSHATHVVVIDTQSNTVVGDIPDTPGVHGFAIAADLGKGFSSNGRENKASIVDLKTLKLIQKVDTGENPDAIMYEPSRHEVYTMNGRGKSATVFDPQTGRVVATWPIAPGETASGMAIDLANHRLFIGCDNKLMVMIDSTTGKVISTVPIGDGVDSNWYDAGTRLAFSSNGGAGTVTIAHEDSPTALKVVQTLKTRPGARTMALDPSTHTLYLATTDYEPQPPGSKERPKAAAGTFRVLVYQMSGAR